MTHSSRRLLQLAKRSTGQQASRNQNSYHQCNSSGDTYPRAKLQSRCRSVLLNSASLFAILLLNPSLSAQQSVHIDDVTPVSGESWLTHLQRPFNETSIGKTGELGPSPDDSAPLWLPTLSAGGPRQTLSLNGSDLYRFNCRGCHGEQGLGAPPEIHSVINPVRATSAALLLERMKSSGADISRAQALQMSNQARTAILDRLHHGGESMPPFGYLQDAEVRSLIAYLEKLADVPGYQEHTVQESRLRVGELIVKSTCHICHDATGANPNPAEILQGAIPPLATLISRTNEIQFIRKVTQGAPILMGTPALLQRGRMPVFSYLTADEAADVYSYLMVYPPQSIQTNLAWRFDEHRLAALAAGGFPLTARPLTEAFDGKSMLLVLALGGLVGVLILAGLAITVSEFRHLSAETEVDRPMAEKIVEQEMQMSSK